MRDDINKGSLWVTLQLSLLAARTRLPQHWALDKLQMPAGPDERQLVCIKLTVPCLRFKLICCCKFSKELMEALELNGKHEVTRLRAPSRFFNRRLLRSRAGRFIFEPEHF